MDVLSNVLSVTNLATDVIGAREFVSPWSFSVEAQDRATVHVVHGGSCWLHLEGCEPLQLDSGDVVLLANGGSHALSSDRDMRDLEPLREAISRAQNSIVLPRQGAIDSSLPSTVVQSATYEFTSEGPHPLLALLPPTIVLSARQASSDSELQLLLRLLSLETTRREAGAELAVPRLMDVLFVHALRTWLREQPRGSYGWLGALRDPQISKALSLIHERPQQQWTVASLARAVAMSRAAFAKRFADLVGEPPLAYITRWRMDIAAKMLRESREPVGRIAGKVGYISETAFAKAFRRRRNQAPGEYRYQRRALRMSATAS
jgi:AraC-like DNA-binding protein